VPEDPTTFYEEIPETSAVDTSNAILFEPEDYPIVGYDARPGLYGGRGGFRGGRPHGGHGGHHGSHGHGGHHGVGAIPSPVPSGSNMLGLAVVAAVAGAGLGWKYGGGPLGALAGLLYGGAAVNAIAAGRDVLQGSAATDGEAAVRGTFAVAGAGAATYILYKTGKLDSSDEEEAEGTEDEEET